MKRNEKLGNITRLIMAVLDYRTPCDLDLIAEMRDYELTFADLRDNKSFVIGVMSGFHMEEIIEKWFLSKIDTAIDEPILEVTHEMTEEEAAIEAVSEGIDALIQELPVEEQTA